MATARIQHNPTGLDLVNYLSNFRGDEQQATLNNLVAGIHSASSIYDVTSIASNYNYAWDIFTSDLEERTKFKIYELCLAPGQRYLLWHELLNKQDLGHLTPENARRAFYQFYAKVPVSLSRSFLNEVFDNFKINQYISDVYDVGNLIIKNVSGKSNLRFIRLVIGSDKIKSLLHNARDLDYVFSKILAPTEITPFIFEILGKENFKEIINTCAELANLSIPTEMFQEIVPVIYSRHNMIQIMYNCPAEDLYYASQVLKFLPDDWHNGLFDGERLQARIKHPIIFMDLLEHIAPAHRLTFLNSFDVEWLSENIKMEELEVYFPNEVMIDLKLKINQFQTIAQQEITLTAENSAVPTEEMDEIQSFINKTLTTSNTFKSDNHQFYLFTPSPTTDNSHALLTSGENKQIGSSRESNISVFTLATGMMLLPALVFLISWIHRTCKQRYDERNTLPMYDSRKRK